MMDTDQSLLRQFVENGDQAALAEFVHQHMDLVYSAALRRTQGDAHAAADVAQLVFIQLARHARRLASHPALTAWLHTATRNAALTQMKADLRRRIRETSALDPATAPEAPADWSQLQPIIDEALDALSQTDRSAILLRFFQHATFREIAAHLQMSEDAARMRTDRALLKLRHQLEKRGVASTTAALGLVLTQQAVLATPVPIATSVVAQACATTPSALGVFGFLTMSKTASTALSGALAASITAGAWVFTAPGVNATELAALRAENEILLKATGPNSTRNDLELIASKSADRAKHLVSNLSHAHEVKAARVSVSTTGNPLKGPATEDRTQHRNRGIATLRDAVFTFAWASDTADVDALANMIWMDPNVREKALRVMAKQPPSLVALYPTPERFYAFITAAVCLQAPPPKADLIEAMYDKVQPQELSPGRIKFPNRHEYQQTEQGWKWVFPEVGLESWLHVLNDSVLTAPSKGNEP